MEILTKATESEVDATGVIIATLSFLPVRRRMNTRSVPIVASTVCWPFEYFIFKGYYPLAHGYAHFAPDLVTDLVARKA
jgi:hypothetical protein